MVDKIGRSLFVFVIVVFFVLVCVTAGVGINCRLRHAVNKPLPTQRYEVKDSANHVIYSYEAHSNRVLTQSPDLTLRKWREVGK